MAELLADLRKMAKSMWFGPHIHITEKAAVALQQLAAERVALQAIIVAADANPEPIHPAVLQAITNAKRVMAKS